MPGFARHAGEPPGSGPGSNQSRASSWRVRARQPGIAGGEQGAQVLAPDQDRRSARRSAAAGRGRWPGRAAGRAAGPRSFPVTRSRPGTGPAGGRRRRCGDRVTGRASAAAPGQPAQRGEQVLPAPAAPGQHPERVIVERLGQHVADRRQVLARAPPSPGRSRTSQVPGRRGNSGVPQSAKTSSISGGISPASSLARNSACPPAPARPAATAGGERRAPRSGPCTAPGRDPCTWA